MTIPHNVTHTEFFKYYANSASKEELLVRMEMMVDLVDQMEDLESKLSDYYESAMEQSDFRHDALTNILDKVQNVKDGARYTETKNLAKEIIATIENSSVEL